MLPKSTVNSLDNVLNMNNNITISEMCKVMYRYVNSWYDSISNKRSNLQWYSTFKKNINLVNYLHEMNNFKCRQTVAKFRSAHCFEIERVRYCRPFSEERWCKFCSQNVCDDECHFLI